jgi:hypothetical protein
LDEALGIQAHQHSSEELIRLGCLLSLVMPYDQASWMLSQWSGLSISASTLWNWVQVQGAAALNDLESQLQAQARGEDCPMERLEAALSALPLVVGADGVMVGFRPTKQSPKGKTQWQEIKVAILARLGQRINRTGEALPQLLHRRVVAVLGNVDAFIPLLRLESRRQDFEAAPQIIWLSDGGRGFWRVYETCFAHCAVAVLDFYHAAGHLWRATTALFEDIQSVEAHAWFKNWRHQLRHGQSRKVISALTRLVNTEGFSAPSLTTLLQVQAYFQRHHRHVQYQKFEQQKIPLGSGMVESTCKWLIQQRFKGVGMRWSEDGFNHLLALRVAWANQRFDDLFPTVPKTRQKYSPND